MSHTIRRGLVLLAAVVLLLGLFANAAWANLDDEPADRLHGTTTTNPSAGEDAWWRNGWGRSLTPDFKLNPPDGMDYKADGYIYGILYSVDRDPAIDATGPAALARINPFTPEKYYLGTQGGVTNNTGPYGTNTNYTLNMLGIYDNPPIGGWPAMQPGAQNVMEGQWSFNYRFLSSVGPSARVHGLEFGIDVTPPAKVAGLDVRTGATSAPVTTWQAQDRAYLTWTPNEYDALAGVGYYLVLLDDEPLVPESTVTIGPKQGRIYHPEWAPHPSNATIENMPPGKHKLSIVCVDRATNEGPAASVYFYSDPDTPTITFTRPTNGLIKESLFISVDASDSAGAPGVKFALDGANIATFTAPPYQFKPNLTGVTPGAHVLSATATDKLGRSVTTTMAVSTLAAVIPPSQGFIVTDDEAFNAPLTGTTVTNPNDPLSADVFWRQGWGNSLRPQFAVAAPSTDPGTLGFVTGMLYSVNRTPGSVVDPSKPASFYPSWSASGTHLSGDVDLLGVFNYPPVGGWPASALGGEVQPYEGIWYFNFLPFTTMAYVPQNTYHIAFGIDVTDPRPITGLHASPNLDVSQAGKWTSASRALVTWDADRYDDLSGVAYYKVLVDDKIVIPDGAAATQGRVYEVFGRTPTAVTIENMPAGKHKISIVAVDRATNEGPATSTYFYSDPDAPKVAFLTPTSSILQVKPSLTATASDLGGVKNVIYKLDGITLGTTTAVPYALTPDLSGFAAGTHVLTATATDMLGRVTTVSRTITLDKTPVKITSFSRNYSLFYPIIRDNYYDNVALYYTLNKAASVTIYFRDSSGTIRRTVTGSKPIAGKYIYWWDGKWSSDQKAHTGTYYMQIVAKDSAGYTFTSPKLSTVIRNYELVKTGPNTVKVVPR